MLTVAAWKWGTKYSADYVIRQASGVRRNLAMPHRYVCITDDPRGLSGYVDEVWPIDDPHLVKVRDGCYARLRMFDPVWQERHGIETIVCLDLDVVIVSAVDPLFARKESVVLLRGCHLSPCRFNGSVQMIRAGSHPEVWSQFNVDEAIRIADADGVDRGTDQTWLADRLPDAAFWSNQDGIYGFQKPGWSIYQDKLPANARLVAFPGYRDPSQFTQLQWVKQHWQADDRPGERSTVYPGGIEKLQTCIV